MSIASVSHGFVFGLSSPTQDNLFLIEENTILYPAGSNVIYTNVEQKSQRFLPVSDTGELITSITVSPDRHVFAVAQKSQTEPSIHVYDLHTFRKKRKLTSSLLKHGSEFISMAFSADGKFLVAQSGAPDWTLFYFPWEKGKALASVCSSQSELPVLHVTINPYDSSEMMATGKGFAMIYRYSDGSLRSISVPLPTENTYLRHIWIAIDRLIVVSKEGTIFLVQQGQVIYSEAFPNNSQITCLYPTKYGFAVGGHGGIVVVYNFLLEQQDRFNITQTLTLSDNSLVISGLAANTGDDTLLIETSSNQIFKTTLLSPEVKEQMQSDETKIELFMESYHTGAITGMDLCIRKPILVTCSADKSVRIWNYLTGECELMKYFGDEPQSVALHPSGLYLLVGFSDKLRLMNILMDDLRPVREFAIRGCKECRFSNGGNVFAAAHGNIVQIYSSWTFEIIDNLKGHNGKIRSLYWTPDDGSLVSAGSDGAVYTWNMRTMKREHEHILKSCGYFEAVCSPNGKAMFAVGTDRMIKEITESTITKEFEANVTMTQVALSNSGRMLFVGTHAGTIRALRFPFGDQHDFQEHQAHAGPVTQLRVSADDQFLFSASEDGCIYMFRLTDKEDRANKKDKASVFADEILITKSDLEEKTVLMAEIQRQLDELKLEHEYQLRLKDMNFNEKLKEITENFSQEIEALKVSTSVLRTEKEKEDVKHQEQIQNLKAKHLSELHELDIKYNSALMSEYEKFHVQQGKAALLQEKWQKQMREFESSTQKALSELQGIAEARLNTKSAEIQRLYDELKEQQQEFEEMTKQNQQDIDTEIIMVTSRYEKKLRSEREDGARLKGENGIMRKKFNTLNKDIDDNKAEILRMKENVKKLESVITMLEKDILQLRKEMADRDEHIQDKERKVYDLKKRNQELEKYKFVLDYRIKELKEQVEPRENHIAEMNLQIQKINTELKLLNQEKIHYEESIGQHQARLEETRGKAIKEHRRAQAIQKYAREFKKDLENAIQYYQDTDVLKKSVELLYSTYSKGDGGIESDFDPAVKQEFLTHQQLLKKKIADLRDSTEKQLATFRTQTVQTMSDNQLLIREINNMRQTSKFRPGKKQVNIIKPKEPEQQLVLPRIPAGN